MKVLGSHGTMDIPVGIVNSLQPHVIPTPIPGHRVLRALFSEAPHRQIGRLTAVVSDRHFVGGRLTSHGNL